MSERPALSQTGTFANRKIGTLRRVMGRAIGLRIVEESPDRLAMRFPCWWPESVIRAACANIERDAKVEGMPIRIEVGHRAARFERV